MCVQLHARCCYDIIISRSQLHGSRRFSKCFGGYVCNFWAFFVAVRLENLQGLPGALVCTAPSITWSNNCKQQLPLKLCSFRERSNFPRIWFQDLSIRLWGPEIKHLKAYNFARQGCLFSHYSLQTLTSKIEIKILTGLLFCAYVEIHQVRILVFDNYQ